MPRQPGWIARAGAVFLGSALAAAALAQGSPLTKPAPSWAGILAAAQKEGRVVFYTQVVPPVTERLKADFEKLHPGISLEVSRVTGWTIIARPEQERKSGTDGADILIMGDYGWLEDLAKEGALHAPAGPAAKDWPADYVVAKAIPIFAIEPFVIVYNTKLVKVSVSGYLDLLKPELKGHVNTPEVRSAAHAAWYEWLEKNVGRDYVARLAAQTSRYEPSAVTATQSVAAGEVHATSFSIMSVAGPMIEQGAPIKAVVPKPSIGLNQGGAVLGWARRPNAALVFLDYLMSRRGQQTWNGRGETASPLPGIPGSLEAGSINAYDARNYGTDVVSAAREKWIRMFKTK